MVKDQLESILQNIHIDLENNSDQRFNFDLEITEGRNQFHILLENGALSMVDGLHNNSIGLLKAKDKTLDTLLQMGADLINSLLDLSFGKLPNNTDLPDIDTRVSVRTELKDEPVNFNIFIEENKLYVIEDMNDDGDIRIRIKPSYLPKLFAGDVNLGIAILTGKIKIRNKGALIKLLAKFGLSF